MLLIPSILLALILFMSFGPDIPFKRLLNQQMVEGPLLWLLRREKRHFGYFIILSAVLIGGGKVLFVEPELLSALLVGGGEMIVVMGPELAMWYAAELALYFDALVLSYLLTALSSVSAAARTIRAYLAGCHRRVLRLFRKGARRTRSRNRCFGERADNDNDDECEGRELLALAA